MIRLSVFPHCALSNIPRINNPGGRQFFFSYNNSCAIVFRISSNSTDLSFIKCFIFIFLENAVPLAIGGHPRKLDNLQLQTLDEAKRKDRIEVKLQCLVCSGQVSLERAQRDIVEDWQAAYHRYARVKCRRR